MIKTKIMIGKYTAEKEKSTKSSHSDIISNHSHQSIDPINQQWIISKLIIYMNYIKHKIRRISVSISVAD